MFRNLLRRLLALIKRTSTTRGSLALSKEWELVPYKWESKLPPGELRPEQRGSSIEGPTGERT